MASHLDTLGLYLHIPFCTTKCTYCAFNTYTQLDHLISGFVEALTREIAFAAPYGHDKKLVSVFLGGGTPSLLTPAQIERIMDAVRAGYHWDDSVEVSLEANPNDLNLPYLQALRAAGINRLSIGMQSADPRDLLLFKRRHDNDAVVRAVSDARLAGFDNLNLDLIYGIPHQTLESWRQTLDQALHLQPDHVSLYALGLEDGTPMQVWVERGQLPEPDDDLTADMYDLATEVLGVAGYDQYEISNWSHAGKRCRHNLQYWYNAPYLGLGPGAHGFFPGVRYSTVLSPQRYIRQLRDADGFSGDLPMTPAVDDVIRLDRDDEIAETLMMGLRLIDKGIDRADFHERYGVELLDHAGIVIRKYEALGLLTVSDADVRLTQQGRFLSNAIFRELVVG